MANATKKSKMGTWKRIKTWPGWRSFDVQLVFLALVLLAVAMAVALPATYAIQDHKVAACMQEFPLNTQEQCEWLVDNLH